MYGFDLVEPTSLAEASQILLERGEGTKLIAGGTALVVLMKQRIYQASCLISTRKIPELQSVTFSEAEGLRIGGSVRHYDIESNPVVKERFPLLADAVHKVGNIRVRQMATIAGNLSHGDYMSDPPAALIALGATLRIFGPEGWREMALADYIQGPYMTALGPGEILAEVLVPTPAPGSVSTYVKFAVPTETERPSVNVAVQATASGGVVSDIALVLGAVVGRPFRVEQAEALIRGKALTAALAAQAAEAAVADLEPIEDGRVPGWYKRDVTGVLVRRALEEIARKVAAAR